MHHRTSARWPNVPLEPYHSTLLLYLCLVFLDSHLNLLNSLPIISQQFELLHLITMDNIQSCLPSSSQLKSVWSHVEFPLHYSCKGFASPSFGFFPTLEWNVDWENELLKPWAPKLSRKCKYKHIFSIQLPLSWCTLKPLSLRGNNVGSKHLPC